MSDGEVITYPMDPQYWQHRQYCAADLKIKTDLSFFIMKWRVAIKIFCTTQRDSS